MVCAGYTKIWESSRANWFAWTMRTGITLRVTRGALWITQERDVRDIVLTGKGDGLAAIERRGLTVVEAQGRATVCVLAHHLEDIHVRRAHAVAPAPRGLAALSRGRGDGTRVGALLLDRDRRRMAGRTIRAHPFANVISPPPLPAEAPTFTVSPARVFAAEDLLASGFSICCWIARFNGRAP